ncbi:MAG: TlpA family protein disulfide reductase [Bacteroidetes bacterium]|nr:TlpA family protein disulfide reductase [Bacteroidota bacterium]
MKIMSIALIVLWMSVGIYAQDVDKAPNFMLENIDGDLVELNDYLGESPILLSFWATWCKPCHEEMVQLNRIYEEYESEGFVMLAISTDNEKSIAKVKPFIKSKGYSFEVLYDTNQEVSRKYYAQMVPYTVIIDKSGEIVYSHMGYKKGDEKKIEELVINIL